MWDAACRSQAKDCRLIDQSDHGGKKFVMSLSIGEMFEIDAPDGGRLLCVVRKLDQRSKRVYYKLHTDARKAGEIDKDNLYLSPEPNAGPQRPQGDGRSHRPDPAGRC